jgi:hypothetical protein
MQWEQTLLGAQIGALSVVHSPCVRHCKHRPSDRQVEPAGQRFMPSGELQATQTPAAEQVGALPEQWASLVHA